MSNKAKLIYIYDPMCSWCWGYAPAWHELKQALDGMVTIEYRVGGLAVDSSAPMPEHMQHMLQNTWHTIGNKLGTKFNFDFWHTCQPRRSTYPACRAALLARKVKKEAQMLEAIQHAYYLQARNPSNNIVLAELAQELGIATKEDFEQQLTSPNLDKELMTEIAGVRALPIQGFPSLVLIAHGSIYPISIDYIHWQLTYSTIERIVSKL